MLAIELMLKAKNNPDVYSGTRWKVVNGPLLRDNAGETYGSAIVNSNGQLLIMDCGYIVYATPETELTQLTEWNPATALKAITAFKEAGKTIKLVRYADDPHLARHYVEITFENSEDAYNEHLSIEDIYSGSWYIKE